MKASLLLCVCLAATSTQIVGCGDQADSSELELIHASGAPENGLAESAGASGSAATASGGASLGELSASGGAESDDADTTESATHAECPDPCAEQTGCGQICITMKGHGSSCQLVPTANDLTRPPRSVQFDCNQIPRGPNGYDFDAQGHIALMGDTCEALNEGGPHRVTLLLACPPR